MILTLKAFKRAGLALAQTERLFDPQVRKAQHPKTPSGKKNNVPDALISLLTFLTPGKFLLLAGAFVLTIEIIAAGLLC